MQTFHPGWSAVGHRQFHQPPDACHLQKVRQADFLSQQAVWHALEVKEDG